MQCFGCGYDLKKDEKTCPYCGRENPNYNSIKNLITSFDSTKFNEKINTNNIKINWLLFIILLIINPVLGIIYIIIAALTSKNKNEN